MKNYDFHYSVKEVDGKQFELIQCTTWPRLNVQVIDTTAERFEEDLKVLQKRSRRVNQQVQNYKMCLKNSHFGVEKFNFSLGLSFNFFCMDIILLSV